MKNKKIAKHERENRILLGLIEYYIKTGKPVGSDTLREHGFQELSPATIRNYFAKLEEQGFLAQQHISGGRIPTDKAFRFYAEEMLEEARKKETKISHLPAFEQEGNEPEVIGYLQRICEAVSEISHTASFISSPRFDQDFVVDIRLTGFESGQIIAALLTNFGFVHTEVLYSPFKLSVHMLKRIENYCRFRLTQAGHPGEIFPEELDRDELEIAHRFYQESVARYLVRYSHFREEDIYRSGFSKLLRYPEFQDAKALTSSLAIFENKIALHGIIRETMKMKDHQIHYWIGEDLLPYLSTEMNCAVAAAAYSINQKRVGVIGIIGPKRMPYKEIFALLYEASESISSGLTSSLYKYRISYRTPNAECLDTYAKGPLLLENQKGDQ